MKFNKISSAYTVKPIFSLASTTSLNMVTVVLNTQSHAALKFGYSSLSHIIGHFRKCSPDTTDEAGQDFHVNLTNEADRTELHLQMFPFLQLFGGCS